MLKAQINNTWHVLETQSMLLVPQSGNAFECAGILKFEKFPMHESIAILFSVIWEFESQTPNSIVTKQHLVASFTVMPKFSSSKYKAKVLPDECVDELDGSSNARLVGIVSGSTNILLDVSKKAVNFHLNKQLELSQADFGRQYAKKQGEIEQ